MKMLNLDESDNCIRKELRQYPPINGHQHFSEIIKLLQNCEKALRKYGRQYEDVLVDIIMEEKLDAELLVEVENLNHPRRYETFKKCLVDSFEERIVDKTDSMQLTKLSDIIYNYQKVAEELYLYAKYHPEAGLEKDTIRHRLVRKFFKVYEGVLFEHEINYNEWKIYELPALRMFFLMKNL